MGIRDAAELAALEGDLTRSRAVRLASSPPPGSYDLTHLQGFHRELFIGLYDWAGELRTVPIAKNDLFCLPQHIESYARNVFGELAREHHLVGLGHEAFIARLAHHLANVNALHPFRDGNGRAQRAFFSQLAYEAGYRLDWQHADHQRNRDASVAAMRGDEQPYETCSSTSSAARSVVRIAGRRHLSLCCAYSFAMGRCAQRALDP